MLKQVYSCKTDYLQAEEIALNYFAVGLKKSRLKVGET
jgi:hypothetical protein